MFELKMPWQKNDKAWQQCLAEAAQRSLRTPDFGELQQLKGINIFLYDETQAGQPRHTLVKSGLFGGMGYTESSDFTMVTKVLGKETHPVVLPIREDQKLGTSAPVQSSLMGELGQIIGEIYTIDLQTVIALDDYTLNTVQYDRILVPIIIPWQRNLNDATYEHHRTEAYMYVGRQEFWRDQLNDASARKLFKPSTRLFNVKGEETTGARFVFDYNIEATRE